MQQRIFGKANVSVSEIGFGTWGMGGFWGPRDDRAAIDALRRYFDHGGNFIDTAWAYGEGHSESLISSALRESKTKAFVATKVPPKNGKWPGSPTATIDQTFPLNHVEAYLDKSLKNLRSEFVDLFQLHVWHDAWLETGGLENIEHTVRVLKNKGKVRFFGVSVNDHQPDTALKIVSSGLIDSVQVIFNLFDQSPVTNLFPLCQKMKVAVIARVPFDEGSLTGSLTSETVFHKKDWRRHYFTPERLHETCHRVEKIKNGLDQEVHSLPDLALRYCLSHPAVSVVIPGMRKISHVDSNCQVSDGRVLSNKLLMELKQHMWLRNFYPSHGH